MPHTADWHIEDNNFVERDDGLRTPVRRLFDMQVLDVPMCRSEESQPDFNTLQLPSFALRLEPPLDRADPQGFLDGVYPRQAAFNNNSGAVFRIIAEPHMPIIEVNCLVDGFDPAEFPIHWRLQCRHVLCRHQPQGNYHYRGACEILEDEWQGKSTAASFRLFEQLSQNVVQYDYNGNSADSAVMGGHAILSVAALPTGCSEVLLDYVHLRIGGTNPVRADVVAYVNRSLSTRDPNIAHMVNAIFEHENNFKQFSTRAQASTHMNFRQKHHGNNASQPDCNVLFNWPDDPADFPSVSFDWGVGISQYTKTRGITVGRETAWDWRANLRRGINEFLGKMRRQYRAGSTWREWAHRSWRAYNGSGAQAEAYADSLGALAEGQQVSSARVPSTVDVTALTVPIPGEPARGLPPSWPPFLPLGDFPCEPSNTSPA